MTGSRREIRWPTFVRDLRNQFAHTLQPLSFADKEIADRCRDHQIPIELVAPPFPRGLETLPTQAPVFNKALNDQPRELFQEVVIFLTEALATRLADCTMDYRMECKPYAAWTDLPTHMSGLLDRLLEQNARDLADPRLSADGRTQKLDSRKTLEHVKEGADLMRVFGEQSLKNWLAQR